MKTPTHAPPASHHPLRRPSLWLAAAGSGIGLALWTLPRTDRALGAWEHARALQQQAAPSFQAIALSHELARELSTRLATPHPDTIRALIEGVAPDDQVQLLPKAVQPRRIQAGLAVEEHTITLDATTVETIIRVIHRIDGTAPAWKVIHLRTYAPAAGEGIDAEMVVQHLFVP